jgi:hypothetical protein
VFEFIAVRAYIHSPTFLKSFHQTLACATIVVQSVATLDNVLVANIRSVGRLLVSQEYQLPCMVEAITNAS